MCHLNIDMSNLIDAFEGGYESISYFLDLETGEVISVTEDARGIDDILFESYFDEQTQTVDWESAFENEHVLDWERELVKDADRVEVGHGVTIIAIPSKDSSEGYSDMEAFIDTVRNPLLRERLERAINWRGPFRNFKDVLLDYPSERDRWFQFKRERLQSRILEWLEEHDINPQCC